MKERIHPVRFGSLATKELRETLRDRRTILTLVLMPILVYPLIAILVQKFLIAGYTNQSRVELKVGFATHEDAENLHRLIDELEKLADAREARLYPDATTDAKRDDASASANPLASKGIGALKPSIVALAPPPPDSSGAGMTYDLEQLVRIGEIHVGIRPIFGESGPDPQRMPRLQLIYDPYSLPSRQLLKIVRTRLNALHERTLKATLVQSGVRVPSAGDYLVVEATGDTVASSFSLVTFVPLMLILMTITGAVYPAIDLTAGERERGTLEALISAPVSPFRVLLAKFVAVLSVALLTAIINLIAMMITMYATGLGAIIFGERGLPVAEISLMFLLLIVFAMFFSAVLLGITSLAKSFKEAQAYLIPVMLLSMSPGIVSLMPDLQMSPVLSVIPLVNIVLMGRDLLTGQHDVIYFLVAMGTTILYAALAMLLASRVFGNDAILAGSTGSWSDLLERTETESDAPTLAQGILCTALLVPGFILLSRVPDILGMTAVELRIGWSGLLTILLCGAVPLGFALWNRSRIKSTFGLRSATPLAFGGAAILGACCWLFVFEINQLGAASERLDELVKQFAEVKAKLAALPLWAKLLALAIIPACCEEFFFRGYLWSAVEHRSSKLAALITSSIVFGLFHILVQSAMFERAFTTALLGFIIGAIRWRTNSLYPGMIFHVLNNGLVLILAHYESELQAAGIGSAEQEHLPTSWLIAAGIGVVIGTALLALGKHGSRTAAKQ